MNRKLILISLLSTAITLNAQTDKLTEYFTKYSAPELAINPEPIKVLPPEIQEDSVILRVSVTFAHSRFSKDQVKEIYSDVKQLLPDSLRNRHLLIRLGRYSLEQLVNSMHADAPRRIEESEVVLRRRSQPNSIEHGLRGRNLFVWSSHGKYYNIERDDWRWQRPNLFCTNEDLLTRSIIFPFLVPMLENAGAYIFTPTERSTQPHEVIVQKHEFQQSVRRQREASATYYSAILDGQYPVYVWADSAPDLVTDARYTVHHSGGRSRFEVNQRLTAGAGYIYLGTFDFSPNKPALIEQSNFSQMRGTISLGAVRFGAGMGSIARNGSVSNMLRYYEAARYYAEYSGMDTTVYMTKQGTDDYAEDINTRSRWLNHLLYDKRIPIDISLALHTDAGIHRQNGIIGTLGLYTTANVPAIAAFPTLADGRDRIVSRYLADMMLTGLEADIRAVYKRWNLRQLWDKNYSETRIPDVPSIIIELLSHQNFTDMKYAHDPVFKFTAARSIYKTLLRYIAMQNNEQCVVQPLPVQKFAVAFADHNRLRLSWKPTRDPLEPSAEPKHYIIYTRADSAGWDNGTMIEEDHYEFTPEPDRIYSFRITAVNDGGASMPSETLTARIASNEVRRAMIVNGFTRIAPPRAIETSEQAYFDIDTDPGVPYLEERSLIGRQIGLKRNPARRETEWGASTTEREGTVLHGNTFDYPYTHAMAMAKMKTLSFISCSSAAFIDETTSLDNIHFINLIFGMQRQDSTVLSLRGTDYTCFTAPMQQRLYKYLTTRDAQQRPTLLLSGAYLATERAVEFMRDVLKVVPAAMLPSSNIHGMQRDFAMSKASQLLPASDSDSNYSLFNTPTGPVGIVREDANARVITLGFPFEAIPSPTLRSDLMSGILNFMFKTQ